jgi:hypothetical protein
VGGGEVGIGHNAIEFHGSILIPAGRGMTIGNVILYGSGGEVHAAHEQAHTYQGEILGPGYLPANIIGGLISVGRFGNWHSGNFMEAGPLSDPSRPW